MAAAGALGLRPRLVAPAGARGLWPRLVAPAKAAKCDGDATDMRRGCDGGPQGSEGDPIKVIQASTRISQ